MKALGTSVVWELTTVALAAGVVLALPLEPSTQHAALLGVAVSLLVGLLALFFKSQVTLQTGAKALQAVMKAQGLTMALRVVAMGLGGLVMKRQGLEVAPFVLAIAAASMVQMVIEMKFLLSAQQSGAASAQ